MPSSSLKQHNLMAMVANDPAKAKQMGIPQSVGQEFAQADKGMKFAKAPTTGRPDLQKINKPKTLHGKMSIMKEGGDIMASKTNPGFMAMMAKKKAGATKKMATGGMTSMGSVKTASPSRDGIAEKGKTKGTMVKMGAASPLGMKKGGMTKKMNMGGKAC